MFEIAASIRAITEPCDAVLVCQPFYYPFAFELNDDLSGHRYFIDMIYC